MDRGPDGLAQASAKMFRATAAAASAAPLVIQWQGLNHLWTTETRSTGLRITPIASNNVAERRCKHRMTVMDAFQKGAAPDFCHWKRGLSSGFLR